MLPTSLRAATIARLAFMILFVILAFLAIHRGQAGRDDDDPKTAVAGASTGLPQDPATGTAAKEQKSPALGDDGVVQNQSKSRMFVPDGKPIYVYFYTADENTDCDEVISFANDSVMPRLTRRIEGLGIAAILGNRSPALRIRPNLDRLRAHELSPDDVENALMASRMVGPDEQLRRLSYPVLDLSQARECMFTYFDFGRNHFDPTQCAEIILKASPDGDILRLKEVAEVDSSPPSSDIRPEFNGRPAAAIVVKPFPGLSADNVVESLRQELEQIRKELFPRGMNFEIIPPADPGMIYAVIETPWNFYPIEYLSAICGEVEAIARVIDDVLSVSSLAGYDIRTEDSSPHAGTCLIRLKSQLQRKLTPSQIIEKLEEKCRPNKIDPECFEPSAISVFVAGGGFTVRLLDRTPSNAHGRSGRTPATFMSDQLNRKDLEGVFALLASSYPQYELGINNETAIRKGISISSALENLSKIFDGDGQSGRLLREFVEDPWKLCLKNDRGEAVPYGSFMRFKKKQG